MAFEEDLKQNTKYVRANLEMPTLPNDLVDGVDEFAFVVQRANVPKDFLGTVQALPLVGSVALKPYLDKIIETFPKRIYTLNKTDLIAQNGDRILIAGNGNIKLWPAKSGEWVMIVDFGNKLKTLNPQVIPEAGYSIEDKYENLELNSIGSVWGGDKYYQNVLLFVFDGLTWRVGGQMRLSDLFPQTPTPPTTSIDTTPPQVILLDKPEPKISNGNLQVKIRTLLIDREATSSTPVNDKKSPTVSYVGKSSSSVSIGGEPLKVQLRIKDTIPTISYVGKSSDTVSIGGQPLKVQLRVEE